MLFWNFAGTLVSGLLINHLHTQNEGDFCEITFCSCSVEKGQKICTCHHPELQHMNHSAGEEMADHHSEPSPDEHAGFCYFSANHNQAQSIPTVLVEFNKLNAVYLTNIHFVYSHDNDPFDIHPNAPLLAGIADKLLKPPRA